MSEINEEVKSDSEPIHNYLIGNCSLCGKHNTKISYSCDDLGNVCLHCDATDKDAYASIKIWRKESRRRKRNAMRNIAKRLKITHRVKFPNEGTCLLDDKVYYYAQKRKARVKGQKKYYQMRGFEHFIKVFG